MNGVHFVSTILFFSTIGLRINVFCNIKTLSYFSISSAFDCNFLLSNIFASLLCIKYASQEKLDPAGYQLLGKFNIGLITIVKKTWPHEWSDFIDVICNAAPTSQSLCENCLKILTIMVSKHYYYYIIGLNESC